MGYQHRNGWNPFGFSLNTTQTGPNGGGFWLGTFGGPSFHLPPRKSGGGFGGASKRAVWGCHKRTKIGVVFGVGRWVVAA